ncbi:hypothetical protein M885DRAFT_620799 [Pelagophyceae sp. CCMP2097]|nr:hypothetical protein M885DRAFT_620799 [Pelagophyceae sp. CCMP2097]
MWLFRAAALAALAVVHGGTCLDKGFTASLRCSSCDKLVRGGVLATILSDAEFVSDCVGCCATDARETRSFDFIDGQATAFAGHLEVKFKQGQKPQLVMIGADGAKDVVSVAGWSAETVAEYLTDNLAQ